MYLRLLFGNREIPSVRAKLVNQLANLCRVLIPLCLAGALELLAFADDTPALCLKATTYPSNTTIDFVLN